MREMISQRRAEITLTRCLFQNQFIPSFLDVFFFCREYPHESWANKACYPFTLYMNLVQISRMQGQFLLDKTIDLLQRDSKLLSEIGSKSKTADDQNDIFF